MSKEIDKPQSEPMDIPERFRGLIVRQNYTDYDDAIEDSVADTTSTDFPISELFTPEQLHRIDSFLSKDEAPYGMSIDAGYGRDCRIEVGVKHADGTTESKELQYNRNKRFFDVSEIYFTGIQKHKPGKTRQEIHEKIQSETQIVEEESFEIPEGFLKKDDLIVIRRGTYAEHDGYIYGTMYYQPDIIPYQTLLLPLTKKLVKTLGEKETTKTVLGYQKGLKSSDMISLRFGEIQHLSALLNERLKPQGLQARLANKQQINVLFCTPQYRDIASHKARLASCVISGSIDEKEEVPYLNRYAGAGIGVSGGIHWYTENLKSDAAMRVSIGDRMLPGYGMLFEAVFEVVPWDADEQPQSVPNLPILFSSED